MRAFVRARRNQRARIRIAKRDHAIERRTHIGVGLQRFVMFQRCGVFAHLCLRRRIRRLGFVDLRLRRQIGRLLVVDFLLRHQSRHRGGRGLQPGIFRVQGGVDRHRAGDVMAGPLDFRLIALYGRFRRVHLRIQFGNFQNRQHLSRVYPVANVDKNLLDVAGDFGVDQHILIRLENSRHGDGRNRGPQLNRCHRCRRSIVGRGCAGRVRPFASAPVRIQTRSPRRATMNDHNQDSSAFRNIHGRRSCLCQMA